VILVNDFGDFAAAHRKHDQEQSMKPAIVRTLCAMLALAAIGCANAKVTQETQAAPVSAARPTQIVIYPFAVDPDDVKLNSGLIARVYRGVSSEDTNAEQLKIAKDTANKICEQVAKGLTDKGYNATCQKRGVDPQGSNVMILDGEFTNIDEGNKARRMVIGLGAGASKLDTSARLLQRTEQGSRQVMEFGTHADSGKMPGAGVMGPAGIAAGGATAAVVGTNVAAGAAKSYTSATSYLADKTATQIVDQVTAYYTQQGWNTASQQ
jgi:hypothetical protein